MNVIAHSFILVLLVGAILPTMGGAVYFVLKEHSTKCLSEDLHLGTKCALVFEMKEPRGNKLRIWLEAPNKVRIFHKDHPISGRYQFTTTIGGPYRICVKNIRDTDQDIDDNDNADYEVANQAQLSEFLNQGKDGPNHEFEIERKTLNMERGDAIVKLDLLTRSKAEEHKAKEEQTANRLQQHEINIKAVESLVSDISSDLIDMKNLEGTIRDKSESLDSSVLWVSVTSSLAIIGIGIHQVVRLKQLLEQKKLI